MKEENSVNPEIYKAKDLIEKYLDQRYLNQDNSHLEGELRKINLNGMDFISLFDSIGMQTDGGFIEYKNFRYYYDERLRENKELTQNYEELEEDYKGILNTLESLLKNPIFSAIEGLIEKIKEEEKKATRRNRF